MATHDISMTVWRVGMGWGCMYMRVCMYHLVMIVPLQIVTLVIHTLLVHYPGLRLVRDSSYPQPRTMITEKTLHTEKSQTVETTESNTRKNGNLLPLLITGKWCS